MRGASCATNGGMGDLPGLAAKQPTGDRLICKSRYLSAFEQMGRLFLYHDLYGFILEMSADVLAFLDAFAEPARAAEVTAAWADRFDGADPAAFVDVFLQFRCLVDPEHDELAGIWDHVPVKGRWNVWRQQDDGSVILYSAWGERPLATHLLSPEEARLWNSFNGETPLAHRLDDGYQPSFIEGLVARLVHHDIQALKLSPVPLSAYRGRSDLQPPYLTSTMPYEPYRAGAPTGPEQVEGAVSPARYYREDVADAEAQFDHQETTLSHLLRRPHPALRGRSYGQALLDTLVARDLVPRERARVLEVGAGLGFVAEAMARGLIERGIDLTYEIVELSPALAAAQRTRCEGLPVTVREGDVLEVALEDGAYDLILSNEMIGDLPAIELTWAEAGIGLEGEARERALDALGDTGDLVRRLGLQLGDAPDPFYLTTGAFRFVERAAAALAPGGVLFASEFGDLGRYPRLSTHLDHPELSIHFGLLEETGKALGLESKIEFIIDLIDLDRDLQGMATTRSYFRALTAMLRELGVELDKIGYTRDMLDELLRGKVDLTRIGSLHFDRIEDRLMGLVPHEFKALLARKPVS